VGLNHQLVGVLQAINKRAGVFSGLDERLLETLSSQAAVAIQRAHLLKEQAEKHRLEHELNLAKEIQSALLPKSAPQPAGYDIAGWNKPAEQTGGDCYDFLTTADPNVLGILLADASGHGIAPALIVSQLRAVLRALSGLDLGLSEMMARANAILCRDLPVGRFVTTFFGMLSTDRNELVYCSAGHGPILHVKPKSKTVKIFGGNACPLGIMPGMQFPAAPIIQIGPGDLVLIITDGFVEWRNPAEELYGNKRLKTFILNHAKLPAADLIARLREDVERFCKGTPQEDDLTAVVIRRSQKSEFRSQKKRRS